MSLLPPAIEVWGNVMFLQEEVYVSVTETPPLDRDPPPPRTETPPASHRAGGKHPSGMHTCCLFFKSFLLSLPLSHGMNKPLHYTTEKENATQPRSTCVQLR